MRRPLFALVVLCTLILPSSAQPWLECAEAYLPAVVDQSNRDAYRLSLVHGYARNGKSAQAQALIDLAESDPEKNALGVMAALGALSGDHLEQALRWAELYLPKTELAWDKPAHQSHGSDRERFLRTARSPESAQQVLAFLRNHGGVSLGSLAFTLRETGGMSPAVSEFYLREFARLADQARPVEWLQIEETVAASGPEFEPLRVRILNVLLTQREPLVQQLLKTTTLSHDQLERGMKKYAASLLARHGRFEEAEALWELSAPVSDAEQREFLQNQYMGGRKIEALAGLTKLAGGLEEDAKVWLSQALLRLNRFEDVKVLGTEPDLYVDIQAARLDLAKGKNVDRWLSFALEADRTKSLANSLLFEVAHDPNMSAQVRDKALALMPDYPGSLAAYQAILWKRIRELSAGPAGQVTLELLLLDDEIEQMGCQPGAEGIEKIQALSSKAPVVESGN